jgi:VWFA-related protein
MRHRRFRFAVLGWLAACGLAGADQPPAVQPPFGEVIEVQVVNVDVHVTDRNGRPVTDLRREDFEVFEDGKRVEVSNFRRVDPGTGAKPEAGSAPPASAPPGGKAPAGSGAGIPPEERLHLIVYVDNFNLDPAHRARVLQQLRGFLADLRPEDRVMMVTHDQGLNVRLPFTDDRVALEAALNAISELPAQGAMLESDRREALRQVLAIREAVRAIEGPCSRSIVAPAESYAEAARQEVLRSLGAMTVLVNSLSGVPGRKALLHVSDGMPATPGEEVFQFLFEICGGATTSGIEDVHDPDLEQSTQDMPQYRGREALLDVQRYSTVEDLNKLAAHANANRVTLYTLQASGLRGTASAAADLGPEDRLLQLPSIDFVKNANLRGSLTLLASETGGRAIFDANDVTPDLRRMKEELGSYYSLGYAPPHSGDGRVHRIEVKVRQPGLQVRHRKSYRDKPAIERAVDRILAAVYHGFEDNPLEVELEIGTQTPAQGDRFLVPIKLRIPLFRLGISPRQDQSYQGKLRLLVSTRDGRGGVSPLRQVEVPLQIPPEQILYAMGQFYEYELTLTLPRGEQHVAIGVRDESTTTTSVLSRTLTVGPVPSRGASASPGGRP